ncbi:hypothetical protein M408DRAFT_329052 [Serendipita vermifera MAFF 305830]|uniref:Thioredoxin domain-containing protein n=1 Tax=Serendipita vermifera MAFF 305830 TaxID=933852 RepID=A0A0C3BA69_SERVB|nr:hypothetical protein M408DRAFT_329052 [Serendipita vermifera MAFF 305830]
MKVFAGIVAAALGTLQVLASASTSAIHSRLVDLAAKNGGVVPLDAELFEQITEKDREWTTVLQFTAMAPNMKCTPCREFAPHFATIAKAWSKVTPEQRDQHFFATLDFADAVEVFRRLQLVSAPALFLYPAGKGPRRPANGKIEPTAYDFNSHGFEADIMAEVLSAFTPVPIPYKPPFNWAFLGTVIMGIVTLLVSARFILPILSSRWTWAAVIIAASVVFTSGIMFVRIRGSPWVGRTKQGASWLAGGYQNQYGMEVQVIAGVYGTLAFSYVALIFLVPRILSPTKQRIAVYIWCCVILLLFSVLLSLFSVKNTAYPFRLLL